MKKIFLTLAFLLLTTPGALAWSDYMQAYGTSKTEAISVNPGTFSFEVDGVPSGYFGEWYVNGVYKEYDTATLTTDPTYSSTFSSGTTQIKCLIYNKTWTLLNSHVWNVTAVLPTFTIGASAGTGGSVSPSSRTVSQGSTTTFTVTPATGYTRGSVSGDASGGSWSGNTYTTAAVTQNRTLTFSFVINTYTVSATAGTGGSVSPSSRSVSHGGTTTFTVTPATGYTRGSVSGDASGGSWSGNTYTTAAVTQNRTLTFSFVINSYTVSAAAGTGGTVSPSSRTVNHGSTTTFSVSPSTYYTRNSVSGDASGGSWSGNTYTTAPVTQNRSLSFTFTGWPDLIVTSVWTEPASPLQGQSYVIKATVRNQGVAVADPPLLDCIEMGFWVDGIYKGGEQASDLCYSISANGGEYTFTSVSLTAPAGGSHTILAKGDCNDSQASDVDESNEGNNDKSVTITVTTPSYTISAAAGTGGGVTPSSRTASQNSTTTFAVSPSSYYTRNSVSGDAAGGSWSGNTYTTAPVTQNRSLTFSFTPWPDLIVSSVWTVPATPVAGSTYVIKATVRNQGVAVADPPLLDCIEMGFWVDGNYVGGEQASDLCYSIDPNGGEYTFTSVALTAPAGGSHTILAKGDCNDSQVSDVGESDEGNNDKSVSVTVTTPTYTVNATASTGGSVSPSSRTVTQGNATTFAVSPAANYTRNTVSGDISGGSWSGNTYTTAPVTQNRDLSFSFTAWPDLIVTSVWTEPATPLQGQSYVIKATVRNQGPAEANPPLLDCIEMGFWINGNYVGGEQASDLCYSIAANGAEFTFTSITLTAPAGGPHTILAKGDCNDSQASDVDENNEGNNDKSVSFTVIIPSYTVSAMAGAGGTVSPSSRTVTNGNTTSFTVSPATYYTRNTVAGDAAGGSWSGSTYTTAPVSQNRNLTFSFTAWPDLIVANVWTVPANPEIGESYVIKALVRNQGSAVADPSLLDCIEMGFWVDGNYVGGEQLSDLCYSIASNGGEFTFTSISLTAPSAGTHSVLAKADCNDSRASDVDEINEGNNELSVGVTVTLPPDPYGVGALEPAGIGLFATIPLTNRVNLADLANLKNNGLKYEGRLVNGTDKKLLIVIHGWNPDNMPDARLMGIGNALSNTIVAGRISPQWRVIPYDWSRDASTGDNYGDGDNNVASIHSASISALQAPSPGGGTNITPQVIIEGGATESAERAYQHGLMLGAKILQQVGASNLHSVQLVAHSAGSWLVYGAVRYLNANASSSTYIQATFLDPYVPGEVPFNNNPAFSLTQLASTPNFCRVIGADATKGEQYWASDITVGTDSVFPWSTGQGVIFRTDGFTYGDAHWDGHGGPVVFYEDTINNSTHPEAAGHGWKHSLAYNEGFIPPTIRLTGDLAFEDVLVGGNAQRTLTIHNDGTDPLSVSSVSLPARFTGNWAGTIAGGGSHDVPLTFSPSAAQDYSGNVTVSSDATSGTNTRAASGRGIARVIRLTGDLSFGGVDVGLSANRTVTIHNDGNVALSVSNVNTPAGFSGSWSGTVSAGGSQDVTITFSPTSVGPYSGTVSVSSDATSGTDTCGATGTGNGVGSIINLSGNLAFGSLEVGTTATRTLTIHNDGSSSLNVSGVSLPNGFTGDWSGSIPAGETYDVTITFAPRVDGASSGSASVSSDASAGTSAHPVSGTGTITLSLDSDGDGVCDAHEAIAGTEKNDKNSYFHIADVYPAIGGGTELRWASCAGRKYNVLICTDLKAGFTPLAPGLDADPPENKYTDSVMRGSAFFLIEVYLEP